ncbi:MAG TPA: hypothetical protein EYQ74_13410 [Planctomycetes bacterium]|nr:hypothetical protein [Planctomycetota bacterium]HIK61969.1 hypothetical protein [Planctomycetota bacterium]
MKPSLLPHLLPLVASLMLVACAGPGGDAKASAVPRAPATAAPDPAPEGRVPPTRVLPTPWTDAFLGRAILLADLITIEGPAGLVEHCVMTLDDALFERTELPTTDGLELVLKHRAGTNGQELLRAQIDAWNLAAYKEIRMVLRAGLSEVIVTAEGNALWKDTDGTEQRGPRLLFRGQVRNGSHVDGASLPGSQTPR